MEIPEKKGTDEQSLRIYRKASVELFVKILEVCPQLFEPSKTGAEAAGKIINATDLLMAYLVEGKKPSTT